jgi:hypothetical protein
MKLILVALFISLKVYPDTRVYKGVSKYQGEVVYFEKHREDWDEERLQGSVVTYTDSKGKEIASLVSDFSHGPAIPNYILRDRRSQSLQGVRWNNENVQTFTQYQKQQRAQLQMIFPSKDQLTMAGPGLVVYVADNLEFFISKNILDFQYIIPGRVEVAEFYIKYIASTNERIEFEVGLSPWPFHIFGTRMKLIFDRHKKRLIFYKGPSAVRNEENHMMTIETDFYYSN